MDLIFYADSVVDISRVQSVLSFGQELLMLTNRALLVITIIVCAPKATAGK